MCEDISETDSSGRKCTMSFYFALFNFFISPKAWQTAQSSIASHDFRRFCSNSDQSSESSKQASSRSATTSTSSPSVECRCMGLAESCAVDTSWYWLADKMSLLLPSCLKEVLRRSAGWHSTLPSSRCCWSLALLRDHHGFAFAASVFVDFYSLPRVIAACTRTCCGQLTSLEGYKKTGTHSTSMTSLSQGRSTLVCSALKMVDSLIAQTCATASGLRWLFIRSHFLGGRCNRLLTVCLVSVFISCKSIVVNEVK